MSPAASSAQGQGVVDAIKASLGRLQQVGLLWKQASENYFDPLNFQLTIQNCISTCRTVTFIVQSNKAAIPGFDNWYPQVQEKFAADPIMVWARDARNKIEKQGDLSTLSQVQATLYAAYAGNPITEWMPDVFQSLDQLRHSIPKAMLTRHVVENGTLRVERRWVDVELPEHELLDALSYVYGQLALMLLSLHEWCSLQLEQTVLPNGEHPLAKIAADGRLNSMTRHSDRAAVYVQIKDGSIVSYNENAKRLSAEDNKKLKRRYANLDFSELKDASSFEDMALGFFKVAQRLMLNDGYHISLAILLKDARPISMIQIDAPNRAAKYIMMQKVARQVKKMGANAVLHIGEAWLMPPEKFSTVIPVEKISGKREALILMGASAAGDQIHISAEIVRKKIKRNKVKKFLPAEITKSEGHMMSMAPVLEVWGRLDMLRLDEVNLPADD